MLRKYFAVGPTRYYEYRTADWWFNRCFRLPVKLESSIKEIQQVVTLIRKTKKIKGNQLYFLCLTTCQFGL